MNNFLNELSDILFLDIETASAEASFDLLPQRLQEEWLKKEKHIHLDKNKEAEEEREPGSLFFNKAGIYAEFGKVITVGVGYFHFVPEESKLEFRTKSYAEETEYDTLSSFAELLKRKSGYSVPITERNLTFPI